MQQNKQESKISNNPIGIFDSGFGGLTVMSEINKYLPLENLIYFGDTAHVPYGTKSKSAVIKFSKKIALFLIKNRVKLIVIACNTASAFALDALKKTLKIPIIDVIRPGALEAVSASKNKRIGVIGTEGTVNSQSYPKEIKKILKSCDVYQQACSLLVSLAEEGLIDGEITDSVVNMYIKPLLSKKIDTLILGCTHYPLLKKTFEKNVGNGITLIDSAKVISKEVKNILEQKSLLSNSKRKKILRFYVSDNPVKFQTIGSRFFHKKILSVKKIELK
jgi:glutamate racemase